MPVSRAALTRRAALLLPIAAAACASDPPPPPPTQPDYSYLSPLRLNVLDIEIMPPENSAQVLVSQPAPLIPAELMQKMARQRIQAVGSSGKARFIVETATLTRTELSGGSAIFGRSAPQRLAVMLRCRLEVLGNEGRRVGFAEAEVRRTQTLPDNNSQSDIVRAADSIVRQAMDDLNVEFEFQVRRTLRDWLMEGAPSAPSTAPIQTEDLPRAP
ncbi:hypothetical protein IAI18_16945 [Acetobacteraceae bacterium H6797]|nr:hypothetical protein [Acetobacteraceae bacterium H6797]